MNRDIAAAQWRQLKGKVREQWGRLTNDEIDQLEGRYDQLVGKVQERYGRSREEASREVDAFLKQSAAADVKHRELT